MPRKIKKPFNDCYTMQSNGCWLWNSVVPGQHASYSNEAAHRYAYRTMVGPIPEGYEVDHLCCNPSCVNPHHLQPVTKTMNMLRSLWHRGYSSQLKEKSPEYEEWCEFRAYLLRPIFVAIDDMCIGRSQLAKKYGITRSLLYQYENGLLQVPQGFIDWMIGFLGLDADAIPPEARELVERKAQTTKGA